MANMLFANNCNTTLNGSITAIATSMVVTSATGFPSPTGSQYFYCTLADAATQTTIEIVKVTAISGTTFTIVRGQDGTSGTAFASGAVVSLRLVRASLNDFPKLDEVNTFTQTQTFSVAPITSTLTGFVYANGASAQTVATTAQALSLIGTVPVVNGGTGVTTSTGSVNTVLSTSPTLTTPIILTTLGVGGVTPSASGAGVSFPATQSASSDANTLDDYEEGTWTPSLGGSTTYLAQAGTYTKIGRVVNFKGVLYINAIGTGSTTQITGLPFTSAGNGGAVCAAPSYGGIATAISSMNANVAGTIIYFQSNVIAATTNQTANAIFQNTAYVEFSGTYAV